ncbi:MAG: DNA-directed RNA polymerase subunit omega [Prolixibacteraceae bacterium]|jgi:DNA-directed RNA polymerase subunit K/omega|nr:DNA-directed RNA polymerase subunit omega [Prolixibacteraceae bacterium]
MDYKKTTAANNTISRDIEKLANETGNIYETVMILAKRSNQIASELKEELNQKLSEFASFSDNLEEVFENREQIEISKFYERLPKSSLIATQEFIEQAIYHRNPLKVSRNNNF